MKKRRFAALLFVLLFLFSACSQTDLVLPDAAPSSPASFPAYHRKSRSAPLYIPPEERIPRIDKTASEIYEKYPLLTPVNYASPALLPLTEDAGEEYLEKLVFLCDSPSYWLWPFGLLPGGTHTTQVWTGPEGTMTLAYLRGYKIFDPIDQVERTIPKTMAVHQPEYVVIAVGLNGVAFMDEEYFVGEYRNLISEIRRASPDTILILQSMYPISPASKVWGSITNAKITRANAWILRLAEECSCRYLDAFSCLVGPDGNARREWSLPDGFHPNKAGLSRVVEYVRTHAYLPTPDRLPDKSGKRVLEKN